MAAPANSAAALDWYLQQRVANNLWCANHADEVSSKSSLKTRLRAHIDCVPGRGGTSIVYVGADGATESTHLHAVHGYGTSSTIKIGIAYAVARAIDANSGDGITWNTLVNVGSQYGTNQSGTLTANQNFTVRYLVRTMLANSNDWAPNRLVDFLTTGSTHGMGFINQQFASLGLNVTHMERYMTGTGSPSAHGNGSSPVDYRDGYDNISSPAEITQLLRFVTDNYHPAIGTLLTASSYEAFWEAMSLDGDQMTPTDNDSVYEKGNFNDFFSDDIFPDWEDAATQASKAGSNCWGFSSDCTNPAVAEVGDYAHKPQIGAHLQRSDAGRLTFADGSQAFFGVFIDEADGPNTQPLRDAIGCVGFETFVEFGRNIVARTPSDCELSDGQVLTVNGTDAADDIVISYDSPTLTIDLNGQVIAVDTGGIDRLVINGFGGKDEITFESLRFGLPTTVNAGDGAATIHIGDGTVGDVQSVIDVNGDGGADKLRIFGQDQTGEDEYRVRKNHVKWKGSKLVNYDSIATLSLKANGKDNTIYVDSLDAETDLTIRSRGGADTIRIGTGSGRVRGDVTVFAGNGADVIRIGNGDVDSRVLGSVTVHGEGGYDELRIEDSDDQHGDDSYTIDASYF